MFKYTENAPITIMNVSVPNFQLNWKYTCKFIDNWFKGNRPRMITKYKGQVT